MSSIGENGNGMVMPVAPTGNGGFGGFGSDGGWWIILLVILFGWGGNWNGNGNGVQSGFNQAALTSGINDIQVAVCNGFAQAEIAANNRQMADMQQMFGLQQQFSNCCCENRQSVAELKYDLTNQFNAGIQALKDEFCNDRLSRKDEKIAELIQIINEKDRIASQNAQTAAIIANNEAQTVALEQYLAPVARPAYIVQNPNCCPSAYQSCGAM